jgi:hypothetical protein
MLAHAFFYAGAHALLVSHWSVDSQAATRLTASTFTIMKRASELRAGPLAYMNDKSDRWNPYPAFWGRPSLRQELRLCRHSGTDSVYTA